MEYDDVMHFACPVRNVIVWTGENISNTLRVEACLNI